VTQRYARFLLVVSKRFRYLCKSNTKLSSRECQKHFEASPYSGFSHAAVLTGIHFARDTEIGRINHFAADEIAGEYDRIKFTVAGDAELSYGFVCELIMFRNRRPGDRERTVCMVNALCERERVGDRGS